MSEPNPPRRPLATFLRAASPDAPGEGEGRAVADGVSAPLAAHDGAEQGAVARGDIDATPVEPLPSYPDEAVASVVDAPAASPAGCAPPVVAAAEPVFLRAPVPPAPAPRWQWGVIAGLLALLLLQIAVADRERLAADAATRPWIAGLCGVLRCTLPAWHEPAAFTMISREIRPVPGQTGTLQVQAAIRNDAQWAQAWPALRLTLSDADGRVIGSGVFSPRQYLPDGMDGSSRLEPGQSAQLAFQVREPAASTVAFTFDFL